MPSYRVTLRSTARNAAALRNTTVFAPVALTILAALAPFALPLPASAESTPPLNLENARPAAVPPPPRLSVPAPPPAPSPLELPTVLSVPAAPELVAPAPVPPPASPAGAPPIPAPVVETPATNPAPTAGPVPATPTPATQGPVATRPPSQAIPSVVFAAESSAPSAEADAVLKSVAVTLNDNPALRLQLRAYAAGTVGGEREARQLSLARALAVRERLTALGIRSTRIDVRPLGQAVPSDRPTPADRVDLEYING